MDLPVTDDGVRPAGNPNFCFYCHSPIGCNHTDDCVLVRKSVVVKMTVEYVVAVPRSWGKEDIEFHRNDSSWCSNNALAELERATNNGQCLCMTSHVVYLRDATEEDHEFMPVGIQQEA